MITHPSVSSGVTVSDRMTNRCAHERNYQVRLTFFLLTGELLAQGRWH